MLWLEKHSGTCCVVTTRLCEVSDGSRWKFLNSLAKMRQNRLVLSEQGGVFLHQVFGIDFSSLFLLLEACNETCSACTNGFECSSCQTPLLLKDGQCVTSCGEGYVQDQLLCTGTSKQKRLQSSVMAKEQAKAVPGL